MSTHKHTLVKEISAITILLSLLTTPIFAEANGVSRADMARRAAAEGKLAYKLTTPEELKALLGPAEKETMKRDGGMDMK